MGRSDSIDKIGPGGSCQTSEVGTYRGFSNVDEASQKNFKYDKLASSSIMVIEDSRQGIAGYGGISNKKTSSLIIPQYEESKQPRKIT
jgi:hypothetical protein